MKTVPLMKAAMKASDTEPGRWGNLPAGEAYIAPVEESVEGIAIIDGSMAPIGFLKDPIRLRIEKGRARSLDQWFDLCYVDEGKYREKQPALRMIGSIMKREVIDKPSEQKINLSHSNQKKR